MVVRKSFVLLLVVVLSCDAQFAHLFSPKLKKRTRSVVDEFSKTPLVSFAAKTSGDLLATAVQTMAWGPSVIARALGVGEIPLPGRDSNVVDSLDRVLADFNTGLGGEDASLPITSMVPKYGYPFEKHEIVTEDGYMLSLFRIPGSGSVVFLMHGLLGSADDFVVTGPDDGLAYLLADQGYDVWMGNARGNKHSRRHVDLTPADAAFWDFSWHEIGYYDLPAMIEYVLYETGHSKLKYIGHSQGTTAFFVMASERPKYNEMISLMIALSPVAYVSHVRSPMVRLLAPGSSLLHVLAKSFGIYEFLPDDSIMRNMKSVICGNGAIFEILCSNVLFLIAGFDFAQLNFTTLPTVLGHAPSGASAKQFAHYGQGVISGDFRQFDYGRSGNLERYGTEEPPSYRLEQITAPVSLFFAESDWLAHPTDVDMLYNRLNNTVDIYKVPFDQFNHLDYIWAKDFRTLVYKRVRKLLKYFD